MLWSPALPERFKRVLRPGVHRHQRHPVRVRRPAAPDASATTPRSPAACRRCAVGKADAVLRRPGQPRQGPALRDQRRPRRDDRRAGRARRPAPVDRRRTSTTTRCSPALRPDAGLAGRAPTSTRSTSSTTCTTSTPTSASRWRCTTTRCTASWPAASPASRSPPTACRRSSTRTVAGAPRRDRPGRRLRGRGRLPGVRQQRRPGRRHRRLAGRDVHGQGAPAPHLPGRRAHPVGAHHHLQRRLRQAHRQHPGRPPRRRAVRARAPTR